MFLISLAQCDLQVQSMKLVPANMNRLSTVPGIRDNTN